MICERCWYWRDVLSLSETGLPLGVEKRCAYDVTADHNERTHLYKTSKSCSHFADNVDANRKFDILEGEE